MFWAKFFSVFTLIYPDLIGFNRLGNNVFGHVTHAQSFFLFPKLQMKYAQEMEKIKMLKLNAKKTEKRRRRIKYQRHMRSYILTSIARDR
jgi:hypothetical protein